MRIGVVSDTHGNMRSAESAAELLKQNEIDVVLHCGDIGSADIIPVFEAWPTHFVFGNVDGNEGKLRQMIEACGLTCHDRFGELQLEGVRIALLHSDDRPRFLATIDSGDYDLVCYGHTHVAKHEMRRSTHVLNPGALHRADPYSVAIVTLPDISVRHLEVSTSG